MRGKKTGGRAAGTLNKVTASLKDYAGPFTTEAIDGLVALARSGKTPAAARVAAWREVLDRGAGRAPQSLTIEQPPQIPSAITFVITKQPGSENRT